MEQVKDTLSLYLGVLKRVGYTMTAGLGSDAQRNRLLSIYQLYAPGASAEDNIPEDPYILPKTPGCGSRWGKPAT